MKRKIYALASILFAAQLNAQTPTIDVPQTEYCFNWNIAQTQWDSASKRVYVYTNLIKDGEVLKSRITQYSYNVNTWDPSTRLNFEWSGYLLIKDSMETYVGNNWQNQNRSLRQYDANANEISVEFNNWNTVSNAWDPTSKVIKQYNAQNLLVERTNQNYTSGQWTNSFKRQYFYDTQNRDSILLSLFWNSGNTSWDSTMRESYVYSNMKIERMQETYSSGTWNYSNKTIYNTDAAYELVYKEINLFWNSGNAVWDSSYQKIKSYDANNRLIEEIGQNYNSSSNVWENSNKRTLTYDSFGNITYEENFVWDTAQSAWVPSMNTTYTFDANGVLQEYVNQMYNAGTNQYDNSYKCEYLNFTTIASVKDNKMTYYKCRFQNPFSQGAIICNLDDNKNYLFTLYDLTGKVIYRAGMRAGMITINESLSNGLYIMQIEDENGNVVANDKVIIEQQ